MAFITSRGRGLAILVTFGLAFILLTTGLRFYVAKALQKRSLRADDYLILVSLASLIALDGAVYWAIDNGLGAHTTDVPWAMTAVNIKMLMSSSWTWTIATTTCKLSILIFYREVFGTERIYRRIIQCFMVAIAAFAPIFIIVFMTQCHPVSAAWDPVLSLTNCRTTQSEELASVSANMALDICVLIFPIPIIWKLQMSIKKRLAVTSMFGLGIGAIAAMVWRLATTADPSHNDDVVYTLYTTAIQSHLELWFGILAANLPRLAPLGGCLAESRIMKYMRSWTSGSSKRDTVPAKVPLSTFGSSGRKKRGAADDFVLLGEENDRTFQDSISRHQEFTVTIEDSFDQQKEEPPSHIDPRWN
ncbi:hypothetical protein GGR52DRAFT_389211 [Hypoxylon sp. FL1284]|nr:hypothetical protein GGR52DRAFT_389211 [Hypoxylon sp. FL1284]